jgi:hypothetical protein
MRAPLETLHLIVGYYSVGQSKAYEWNTDILATYDQDIGQDWNFNLNLGGNILQRRNNSISADTGPQLTVPEFFALSNTQLPDANHSVGSPKDVHSLYSFGQLGYKNAIFLDVTGRNDWNSTLPRNNWSYFYPSVGLGVVISDLMHSFPSFFTFAKLRASYAEVGNDTDPYRLQRTASVAAGGLSGFLAISAIRFPMKILNLSVLVALNLVRIYVSLRTDLALILPIINPILSISFSLLHCHRVQELLVFLRTEEIYRIRELN